jgi:putative phage-type endonuclease
MINEIFYKDKAEWLALRRELGVGGSEAGSVVGMNPYKSAYTLWAEKTGQVPEFEGNLTTDVGSYLEDFVAKLFEKETGKKVRRKNCILVNTQYPFAFGDVDRVVVGENSVLEIKTTNSLPAMKKFKNGEYCEQWYCQMMHYLAVGGFDKAYLAVLIGCRDFKIFELKRDEDEIKALMQAEESFWNNVKTNTPPTVDGTDSTTKTISTIFAESNEDSVSLYAYETDLRQYMALGEQIKALKEQQDEMANKVKAFLGESGGGESNRFKVSWTSSERSSFDSKRFAKDHPDVDLSAYYKYSTVRTFRVTEKNND